MKLFLLPAKKIHIPVAVSMGGGYSPDIKDIVEAHCKYVQNRSEGYFEFITIIFKRTIDKGTPTKIAVQSEICN